MAVRSNTASLLTDITQILDVVRQEWSAENSWSEWDQSVRDRITAFLLNDRSDDIRRFVEALALGDPRALADVRGNALEALGQSEKSDSSP